MYKNTPPKQLSSCSSAALLLYSNREFILVRTPSSSNALMTYFQSKGQSATGASPISSNGASASGQATAAQASSNAALSASLPFAFAVTVGDDYDLDYQQSQRMAAPVSSRGVTNLLDYKLDPDVLS